MVVNCAKSQVSTYKIRILSQLFFLKTTLLFAWHTVFFKFKKKIWKILYKLLYSIIPKINYETEVGVKNCLNKVLNYFLLSGKVHLTICPNYHIVGKSITFHICSSVNSHNFKPQKNTSKLFQLTVPLTI